MVKDMIVYYDQGEIREVQKKQKENKFADIKMLKNLMKMTERFNIS